MCVDGYDKPYSLTHSLTHPLTHHAHTHTHTVYILTALLFHGHHGLGGILLEFFIVYVCRMPFTYDVCRD